MSIKSRITMNRLWKKWRKTLPNTPERDQENLRVYAKKKNLAKFQEIANTVSDTSPQWIEYRDFVFSYLQPKETPTLTPTPKDFEIPSVKKYVDEIETLNNLIEKLKSDNQSEAVRYKSLADQLQKTNYDYASEIEKLKSDNQEYLIKNNELQLQLSEKPTPVETPDMTKLLVHNGNLTTELEHSKQREELQKAEIQILKQQNHDMGVKLDELERRDYDKMATADQANYTIEEWKRFPQGLPFESILDVVLRTGAAKDMDYQDSFDYSAVVSKWNSEDWARLKIARSSFDAAISMMKGSWHDFERNIRGTERDTPALGYLGYDWEQSGYMRLHMIDEMLRHQQ